MKTNPDWQLAEDTRVKIEEEYTSIRLQFERDLKVTSKALEDAATSHNSMANQWHEKAQELNSKIEQANQKVRSITQFLPED